MHSNWYASQSFILYTHSLIVSIDQYVNKEIDFSHFYSLNEFLSLAAYLCGIKANFGTAGVSAKVPLGHCTAALDKSTHVNSIAQWALDSGKSIGLVTTTTVTHASPSG